MAVITRSADVDVLAFLALGQVQRAGVVIITVGWTLHLRVKRHGEFAFSVAVGVDRLPSKVPTSCAKMRTVTVSPNATLPVAVEEVIRQLSV